MPDSPPSTMVPEMAHLRFATLLGLTLLLVMWFLAGPENGRLLLLGAIAISSMLLAVGRWAVTQRQWSLHQLALAASASVAFAVAVSVVNQQAADVIGALWLVGVAVVLPVQIVRALARRRLIDVEMLLGAITVYLLVGLWFAMAFVIAGHLATDAMFAFSSGGTGDGTFRDIVYYSFVTMSTTGYGDITPVNRFARALAVLEAIGGQVYLVTAVAMVVSALTGQRR